jgi:hypothetical protein
MLLKGKKYSEAASYYQTEYLQGNRSTAIMVPLKTLEVASGDNDKAIRIMEQYVRQHPNDVHALELLGNLYLNSKMRPQYLANLEKIKRLSPNPKILEELLGWYHVLGEKKKEEALLWEILESGYASPTTYMMLAYLLASRQEYKAAYELLQDRNQRFPKAFDFETVNFQVTLLNEQAKASKDRKRYDEQIINLARHFILTATNEDDVVELIASLKNQKRDDLAYSLIPFFKHFASKNPQLETDMILLEASQGDKTKAYDQLLRAYSAHPLNAQLAELMTSMAIDKQYFLILDDLLTHISPIILSESTLLWIALTAEENKNFSLLDKLEHKLGPNYFYTHPIVQAGFLLARKDPKGEAMLEKLLGAHAVPPSQALLLMRLAANYGDKGLVLKMGASLFNFKQMSTEDFIYWALIYTDLHLSKEGIKVLLQHQNEIENFKIEPALALLNTASGNLEAVNKWFVQQQKLPKSFLNDLYSVAEAVKAYPFALDVAFRLYHVYPSPDSELTYATALLNMKACDIALVHFKRLLQSRYAMRQVAIGYLGALIECKGKEDEETHAFLNYLLGLNLTDNQLRDIGYLILEKVHDLERAERIFAKLSSRRPINSSDFATYLHIKQESGYKDQAYEQLLQYYSVHCLDATLVDLLARMALERHSYLILADLLDHFPPSMFSASFFILLAHEAHENKENWLIGKALSRLSKDYFLAYPTVQAAFMIVQKKPRGLQVLQELVRNRAIPSDERLILTQMAATAGYSGLASEMGRRLFEFEKMSAEELQGWAMVYVQIGLPEEGLVLLQQNESRIKKGKEGLAAALLNTALGKIREAQFWYERQHRFSKNFLFNLYALAEKVKAYPFALQIANRLFRTYPDVTTEFYFATALTHAGFCQEALSYFRHLVSTPPSKKEIRIGYLQALIACKAFNCEELNSFLDHLLALNIKDEELRDIGSLILDKLHDYQRAESIYLRLAQKEHAKFSDFEILLSLFGPRPPPEIIALTFQAAGRARSEEKIKWVKALQNVHEYAAALNIFMEIPRCAWTPTEYLVWLALLNELKDKESLKEALKLAFFYLTKIEDFKVVLSYAGELGLPYFQRDINAYLTAQQPENPLFWQGLGKIDFEIGYFTEAFDCFNRYFAFDFFDKDYYLIQFLYGEMLLVRNEPLKAEGYYCASLNHFRQGFCLTPDMRNVHASLMDRLRYKWVALRELIALYYEKPNPDSRAAWANHLISMGRLKAARRVLYDLFDEPYIKESELRIFWKEPLCATSNASSNELMINVNLPISESNLQEVAQKLPEGIKSLEAGYHTLLLTTEGNANFCVEIEQDTASKSSVLHIAMRIFPKPFPPSLAIGLARVNLAIAERHYAYAAVLLNSLSKIYPGRVEIMGLIASVEATIGKWQCALPLLAKAHRFSPCNEGIWSTYRDVYFPAAPFLGFEEEGMFTLHIAAEQFYRLRGECILARNCFRFLYFNAEAEKVRAHISQIVNEQGLIEGFLGSRSRGFMKLRSVNYLGTAWTASAYVGDAVAGAGADWLTRFDQGDLFIYVDWNKPYWEILECLVHQGTQDRVGAGGHYFYNSRLDGFIDVGFRDYGEKRARHAVHTVIAKAFANCYLTLTDPYFIFNYSLDAEYVFFIKEKFNLFGELYQPVPLDTRENHTIRLMVRTIWHKYWTAGGYFGETFNRFGTRDWTAGIYCNYVYPCGLEINFSMEHYPSTTIAGASVNDIKAGFKWRF